MHVSTSISLKHFCTFGIDVNADFLISIESEDDLVHFFEDPRWAGHTLHVLGGGSNMLFTKHVEGVVLKIDIKGISHTDTDSEVIVSAKAGEPWHDFVIFSVNQGWYGLENLSLIPGSVGASPIQNIGAYGVEVKDVIQAVRYYDCEEKKWVVLKNSECKFGYRDSIFKK